MRTVLKRPAGGGKISTELDLSDFSVLHFSVFAQPLMKKTAPKLSD
jgi:hypothetical protein